MRLKFAFSIDLTVIDISDKNGASTIYQAMVIGHLTVMYIMISHPLYENNADIKYILILP